MGFEETISEIIKEYGTSLWIGFVILLVTGIIMLTIKNLISDIVNYYTTRMSDLGYGAMILWNGKLKRVVEIRFKSIKVVDDEEILFIPIELWLKSIRSFPQPRNDQFNEEKWREKPWDGKTDRRTKRETNTE